jgi:hypothetical protein
MAQASDKAELCTISQFGHLNFESAFRTAYRSFRTEYCTIRL